MRLFDCWLQHDAAVLASNLLIKGLAKSFALSEIFLVMCQHSSAYTQDINSELTCI